MNYVFFATEYDYYPYMYQEILGRENVKYYRDIGDTFTRLERFAYGKANVFVKGYYIEER